MQSLTTTCGWLLCSLLVVTERTIGGKCGISSYSYKTIVRISPLSTIPLNGSPATTHSSPCRFLLRWSWRCERRLNFFFWPKPHSVLKTPMSQAQKSPLPFFFSSLFLLPSPPPSPPPPSLSCRLSCFLGQLPLSFSIITHSPSTTYASSLREWLHFWRALEYRKN